jgi:DNA-binding CsgD family transcriptional regulator
MSSRKRDDVEFRQGLDSEAPRPRTPSGFRLNQRRTSEVPPSRASSRPPARSRWTVVEEFITGGFRYQLVRRPVTSAPPPQLTPREKEALDYAHQGHSNKSIAFALGLSPSTIGVLLFRAAAKLGVKSREQLLAAYARIKKSLEDR